MSDPITTLERWIRYSSERLQVRPEMLNLTNAAAAQAALEQVRTLVEAARKHAPGPLANTHHDMLEFGAFGRGHAAADCALCLALQPFISGDTESGEPLQPPTDSPQTNQEGEA